MGIGSLLKGKLLVIVVVGAIVAGGAVAMAATSPAGQRVVHSITSSTDATTTPVAQDANHAKAGSATPGAKNQQNSCPGLPEAQQLAARFSLSTDSTSDDVQAICSLHQGTFKGTTSSGATTSSKRVFGYGEIDELLTYAQFLATHDKANASGKLTSGNTRSYLAEALQNCGATPLEVCLKTKIPGFQPGNGGGKPSSSPTPGGGKPEITPTPHH
jgi:hypothetical protein